MTEYIDREETVKKIEEKLKVDGLMSLAEEVWTDNCLKIVLRAIMAVETADVQTVTCGRWIITDDVEHFIAVCSECGRTEDSRAINDMPYCHCGARMDGNIKSAKDGDTE